MFWVRLAACLPDPPVRPGTEVTLEEKFEAVNYPVTGSTWGALMRSADDQAGVFGVAGDGEKTFHGKTVWRLDWDQHSSRERFGCLHTIELSVEVVTVLPEWTPTGTDPALEARWQAWLDRLRVHEGGHGTIALRVAHDFRDAAGALVADPSCASLGKEVDRLGATFSDRAKADSRAYDLLTEHGEHQERWAGVLEPEAAAP